MLLMLLKLETELGWKAEKVNCGAREATLGCENFDSGIVKTVEWYLKKTRFKPLKTGL